MVDALPYPNFVSETDQLELDQSLHRIINSLVAGDAQFLFGAGMSQGSGVPGCQQILKSLLKEYFPDDSGHPITEHRLDTLAGEYPFEAMLEAVKAMPGRGSDLTRKLAKLLTDPGFEPNAAHKDFLSVCWGDKGVPRVPVIFTTNFDRLIEDEIGEQRSTTIIENDAHRISEARRLGKIPVIHLHGTLDGDYLATESQLFADEHRILYYEFEVALHAADAFVFVGYSMNDPDFRRIYMRYRERIKNRRDFSKDTYVVSPAEDFHSFAVGKAIWNQRGAIWFPVTAEVFFAKLKHSMLRQYDSAVRRKVMDKYHLGDDKVLEGYVERTAQILRTSREDALQFLNEALPRGGGGK